MSILEAVIQGVIQGLTEFLPVSSSGHLSIYQHFSGNSGETGFFLAAVLHLGTLIAVFIAFRKLIYGLIKELLALIKDVFTLKFKWSDLKVIQPPVRTADAPAGQALPDRPREKMNGERRMLIMLAISLIVLVPFYALFGKLAEKAAADNDIILEGICFLYTSAILFLADRWGKGAKTKNDITVKNSLVVGIFQGIALLPGISRSGSTICGGLFSGFSRELAVSYSFILGIPTILGGCLLEMKDGLAAADKIGVSYGAMATGLIVSAVVGILSIKMVAWLVKSNKFKIFSIYTALLGVSVITLGILGK